MLWFPLYHSDRNILDLSSLSWTDTRRDRPSEDAERLATEYSGILEEIWCGGI